jgi:hypothetical protein
VERLEKQRGDIAEQVPRMAARRSTCLVMSVSLPWGADKTAGQRERSRRMFEEKRTLLAQVPAG